MAHYTFSNHQKPSTLRSLVVRGMHGLTAFGLTAVMLMFLSWMRWKENRRIPPQMIRSVETLAPVSPPPPAPPPSTHSPPEPKLPDLPKLEIRTASVAPPLKARIKPILNPSLLKTDFELKTQPQAIVATMEPSTIEVRTTFNADELDTAPMLIVKPTVSYPASLARQDILEGRVLLKVSISPDGRASILNVTESVHPELEPMARRFADRARFSPPTKDGRPVTAIYHWPLALKR